MNDTTTDLNRRLAEAMGWTFESHTDKRPNQCGALNPLAHWHNEHGIVKGLPNFTASLDQLRDGPEKMLREAEWTYEIRGDKFDGAAVEAGWWMPGYAGAIALEGEATEAEARAKAALAALLVLNASREVAS